MSIAILEQVYDETRRLAIAGSGLAVGDFRLKKLVSPLRTAGAKAPVFGKVADYVEKLVDGSEKESTQSLLDLSSLVIAILYTQGATGATGKVKPIPSLNLAIPTNQVSSRVIGPLMEALTTTGSGRYEVVREAHERGVFNDLRLVNPAIDALNDGYGELADFVAENVLPLYGDAIVPAIKDDIDIKGRGGHVRRLGLLYKLAPKLARPLVEEAFESGSKEMKIAALGCLGDSKEDLPHLLEQVNARSKDVRRVVLARLAKMSGGEVESPFDNALNGKDLEIAVQAIADSSNAKLVKLAHRHAQTCFDQLVSANSKKERELQLNRLDVFLGAFAHRNDKATCRLLGNFLDRRSDLAKIPDGGSLLERLAAVSVSTEETKLLKKVAAMHSEWEDDQASGFGASAAAVAATMSPKEAYDQLHGYYQSPKGKRGRKTDDRSEAIASLLAGGWFYQHFDYILHQSKTSQMLRNVKWDPRWIKLAVANDDVPIVSVLATAKDKQAGDYLAKYVEKNIGKQAAWEVYQALGRLVEIQHKKSVDVLLQAISASAKKSNKHSLAYWLFPLVSKLPKSALKKVEVAIKDFPDAMIDALMPHIVTLRQKAK